MSGNALLEMFLLDTMKRTYVCGRSILLAVLFTPSVPVPCSGR